MRDHTVVKACPRPRVSIKITEAIHAVLVAVNAVPRESSNADAVWGRLGDR